MPVWKKYKFVIFYLTWRRTNSFQGDWFNLRRFIILIRVFSNLGTVGYMVYLYFNNYKINIVLLMSLEYSSKLEIEYKHDLETYIKISGIKSRSRLMIITAPRTNARMYQYQSTMYTFSFMTFNIRTHKASCLCCVPE